MSSSTTPVQAAPAPPPVLLSLPAPHRASLSPYLPAHSSGRQSSRDTSPPSQPPGQDLPHLTLTYATSLDGAIALGPGVQTALSGPLSKAMTHYLRSRHDAILVGANTAIVDDPALNCRHVPESDGVDDGKPTRAGAGAGAGVAAGAVPKVHQPIPVILDPSARWPAREQSRVLTLAREGGGRGVLWVVGGGPDVVDAGAVARVLDAGGDVRLLGDGLRSADGGVDWGLLLEDLAAKGIRSVMVEGGAKVIMDLLKEGNQRLVSSVVVTIVPLWLGEGGVATSPPRRDVGREVGRLHRVKWLPMGEDVVMAGRFGDTGR